MKLSGEVIKADQGTALKRTVSIAKTGDPSVFGAPNRDPAVLAVPIISELYFRIESSRHDPVIRQRIEKMEHRAGIEPANTGFADQRVSHFATGALVRRTGMRRVLLMTFTAAERLCASRVLRSYSRGRACRLLHWRLPQ